MKTSEPLMSAFIIESDQAAIAMVLAFLAVGLVGLIIWRKKVKQVLGRSYQFLRTDYPEGGILLLLLVLATIGSLFFSKMNSYFQGVLTEFTGLIFDVLFIAIFLVWLKRKQERKLAIQAQQDIIDDFKLWDSKEGRLRIAGSIRRLARLGKTDIDLVGLRLSNFSFYEHSIKDLSGSIFYEGEWGTGSSREKTILQNVGFNGVNLSNAQFSPFHPFQGWSGAFDPFVLIQDCTFVGANLRDAKFDGASIVGTKTIPSDHYETIEGEEGSFKGVQVNYPAFDGAQLNGASFKHVQFKKIDFRNAEGILEADFQHAKGLESCIFDDEETKIKIIESALSQSQSSTGGKTDD